jgi:hypothetical protein
MTFLVEVSRDRIFTLLRRLDLSRFFWIALLALRREGTDGVTRAVYVRAMFSTGHDEANREVFLKEPADAPDLVGLAVRGPKKAVDKAIKGLSLHG